MYFAECSEMTLGKGWFAECQLVDTRQIIVKACFPSAAQGTLGKEYFKIFKKSLPSDRS